MENQTGVEIYQRTELNQTDGMAKGAIVQQHISARFDLSLDVDS